MPQSCKTGKVCKPAININFTGQSVRNLSKSGQLLISKIKDHITRQNLVKHITGQNPVETMLISPPKQKDHINGQNPFKIWSNNSQKWIFKKCSRFWAGQNMVKKSSKMNFRKMFTLLGWSKYGQKIVVKQIPKKQKNPGLV